MSAAGGSSSRAGAAAGAAAAVHAHTESHTHTHTHVHTARDGDAMTSSSMPASAEECRWELVSSPNTAAIADMYRAVFTYFGAPYREERLSRTRVSECVRGLRHGPYLPVLYDNHELVEFNQAVAGMHYAAARVAAGYPSLPTANATRSFYVCETAVRFAREHPLVGDVTPPVSEAQRKLAREHTKMLGVILAQQPVTADASQMAITVGDLCAWVLVRHLVHVYGAGVLDPESGLARLVDAISGMDALKGFEFQLGKAAPATSAGAAGASAHPAAAVATQPSPAASVPEQPKGPVLVTGANGYIASWVVSLLLEKGYTVHATVRSLADTSKYEHLTGMQHAALRLKLFEADLLVPGSFEKAMAGCTGVYHCASPFFFESTDPHEQLIRPAVEGTQNVLRTAIRVPTVRRVVMTSSVAAVYITRKPADYFYSEDDWSDLEYVRETKQHYAESKLLSEREAWRIVKEELPAGRALSLITICPTQTVGPLLQSTVNTSTSSILDLMNGSKKAIPNKGKCFVDVRDVALAHVLAMTTPSASGRYLMIATSIAWRTVADILRRTLPSAAIPTQVEEGPTPYPQALASVRKVYDLGITYTPIEVSLRDCALSLYAKGLLDHVIPPVFDRRQGPM